MRTADTLVTRASRSSGCDSVCHVSQPSRVLSPGFHSRVFEIVRRIPKGKVTTYGRIAAMLGHPGVARHVGYALAACGHEEIPVPWQRVVNASGKVSTGGAEQRQCVARRRRGVHAERCHPSDTVLMDGTCGGQDRRQTTSETRAAQEDLFCPWLDVPNRGASLTFRSAAHGMLSDWTRAPTNAFTTWPSKRTPQARMRSLYTPGVETTEPLKLCQKQMVPVQCGVIDSMAVGSQMWLPLMVIRRYVSYSTFDAKHLASGFDADE